MRVIDEVWWRAEISGEDLRWIQRHLGHGLEGQTNFKTIPKDVSIPAMDLYPGVPWSERIVFVEGEDAPRALLPLGQQYDYRQAYFESRKAGDPYLSPRIALSSRASWSDSYAKIRPGLISMIPLSAELLSSAVLVYGR